MLGKSLFMSHFSYVKPLREIAHFVVASESKATLRNVELRPSGSVHVVRDSQSSRSVKVNFNDAQS